MTERRFRNWEIEEATNMLRALARQIERGKLIKTISGFAGPLGFAGEGGRILYADDLGIADSQVLAQALHNAEAANDRRAKDIEQCIRQAYGLEREDIERLVQPLLNDDVGDDVVDAESGE